MKLLIRNLEKIRLIDFSKVKLDQYGNSTNIMVVYPFLDTSDSRFIDTDLRENSTCQKFLLQGELCTLSVSLRVES